MRLTYARRSSAKLSVPEDLYERIGTQEKIVQLVKIGLLSSIIASLEREVDDLVERKKALEKHIVELPDEIERLRKSLEELLQDQKTLEILLNQRR